jgi:hypothetical protein
MYIPYGMRQEIAGAPPCVRRTQSNRHAEAPAGDREETQTPAPQAQINHALQIEVRMPAPQAAYAIGETCRPGFRKRHLMRVRR